ncbi:MAG: hypothetical protein ACFHVJ_17735 [Aestuariibacter sp.]
MSFIDASILGLEIVAQVFVRKNCDMIEQIPIIALLCFEDFNET